MNRLSDLERDCRAELRAAVVLRVWEHENHLRRTSFLSIAMACNEYEEKSHISYLVVLIVFAPNIWEIVISYLAATNEK